MSQVSSWSADTARWAIQLSMAGQSERTTPAFHSLFGIPMICSSDLSSRVAVIEFSLICGATKPAFGMRFSGCEGRRTDIWLDGVGGWS